MNAPRSGFRHTVNRVRFLASHPDFDDARIVLDELSHRLPAQTPKFREVANAIVLFGEAIVSGQITPLQSKCRLAGVLD